MITKLISFFQEQKISCLSVICNHTIPNILEIKLFITFTSTEHTYSTCHLLFSFFFHDIFRTKNLSSCFLVLFCLFVFTYFQSSHPIISSVIGSSRKGVCDIQMATSHPSHVLYLDATKFYCQVYFLIFTFFYRLLPENQGKTTIKDCIKSTSGYHMQLKNTDA